MLRATLGFSFLLVLATVTWMFSSPGSQLFRLARHAHEMAKQFRVFVFHAWPVIDPEPLVWRWHIECLCDHLQAVTEGHIKKLIINIPPGHAKSTLACVLWPAWEWIARPESRSMFGSYDKELALRDSRNCRAVFQSEWYQEIFDPSWAMKHDSNAMGFYTNTANGNRYTFGLRRGGRTGWRGQKLVMDDPISMDDRYNPRIKKDCIERYDKTLSSRVNDPTTAAYVVIGHRIAYDDLSGHLMKRGDYEVIKLPSLYDPVKRFKSSIGWEDPRKEKGEPLFPEKYPPALLAYAREKELGEQLFIATHQQEASSEEGARFKRGDFRPYEERAGVYILHRKYGRDEAILHINCWTFVSVDFAASEDTQADFTSFGTWMVTRTFDMILLHVHTARMSEPDIVETAKEMYRQSGLGNRVPHVAFICEQNGLGLPIAQAMLAAGLPVIFVSVHEDKFVRSATAAIRAAAGSVFIPFAETPETRAVYPWMASFMKEIVEFPMGDHDDQVDQFSLAAESLYKVGIAGLGGKDQIAAIEKPAPAQVIERPAAAVARGLYGTGGHAPAGKGEGNEDGRRNGHVGRNGDGRRNGLR
jgi:predicted phage terminase large subunit-like protein